MQLPWHHHIMILKHIPMQCSFLLFEKVCHYYYCYYYCFLLLFLFLFLSEKVCHASNRWILWHWSNSMCACCGGAQMWQGCFIENTTHIKLHLIPCYPQQKAYLMFNSLTHPPSNPLTDLGSGWACAAEAGVQRAAVRLCWETYPAALSGARGDHSLWFSIRFLILENMHKKVELSPGQFCMSHSKR